MAKPKNKYILPRRKWRFPVAIERDYQRTLRAVAKALHEATMSRMDLIKSMINSRQDETNSEYVLRLIKEAYAATAATSKAIERARRIAEQVRGFNQQEFYSVLRSAMRVDIFAQDPDLRNVMEEWAAENVRLITSIPDQYFNQLQGIVSRGLTQGTLASDMGEEIQALYGVTNRRAQLIARDQVATLNGLITEKRQRAIGVTFYQWSTSRDARVRESHADREGRFFAYSGTGAYGMQFDGKQVQEPPKDGPPGVPINCRCVAYPVIDTDIMQGYML